MQHENDLSLARVAQWGSSLAIRLPQEIVQKLALTKDTTLEF